MVVVASQRRHLHLRLHYLYIYIAINVNTDAGNVSEECVFYQTAYNEGHEVLNAVDIKQ